MEEWWVSSASQAGPEDLAGWQRPFKRFRAVPHDVWLMSQPVCQKTPSRSPYCLLNISWFPEISPNARHKHTA